MLVGGKSVADVQSYVPQVVGTISAAIEVNFWYYILQEKESDQTEQLVKNNYWIAVCRS
jgi:hypothetical protein